VNVSVDTSGPIFSGMAAHHVAEFVDEVGRGVAQQAMGDWMTNLNASIKRPTPYYETQIVMQSLGPDYVVHDRGVIYGPWLEGTSQRNQTTRFKGYASLRRAVQSTQAKVPQLVAHQLARLTQRLGGGTP
jgi:hypothetical protein